MPRYKSFFLRQFEHECDPGCPISIHPAYGDEATAAFNDSITNKKDRIYLFFSNLAGVKSK
jgi:hypothetical protein